MQSLLQGGSTQQRNTLDSDAHSLGMAKQARRGVETMLDQAAGVLEGMGATRDTLKVRPYIVSEAPRHQPTSSLTQCSWRTFRMPVVGFKLPADCLFGGCWLYSTFPVVNGSRNAHCIICTYLLGLENAVIGAFTSGTVLDAVEPWPIIRDTVSLAVSDELTKQGSSL